MLGSIEHHPLRPLTLSPSMSSEYFLNVSSEHQGLARDCTVATPSCHPCLPSLQQAFLHPLHAAGFRFEGTQVLPMSAAEHLWQHSHQEQSVTGRGRQCPALPQLQLFIACCLQQCGPMDALQTFLAILHLCSRWTTSVLLLPNPNSLPTQKPDVNSHLPVLQVVSRANAGTQG